MLLPCLLLLACGGGSAPPSAERSAAPPTPPVVEPAPSQPDSFAASVLRLANQRRAEHGLPGLRADPRLDEQARAHSRAIAAGQVAFGHEGFEGRIAGAGLPYRGAAENVHMSFGIDDPAAAVDGWMDSPGHRRNLLGDFDLAGTGEAVNGRGERYVTQIYLRRP